MNSESWTFTFELEDNQSTVVTLARPQMSYMFLRPLLERTGCEEVQLRMLCQDPEPIMFTAESLHSGALG